MEERSKIEGLRGLIGEIRGRIGNLSSELDAEKKALSRLYVDLFYAENGMEVGRHFMFDGVEYVRVEPRIYLYEVFFEAYRYGRNDARSVWGGTNVFPSDYYRIKPIPMEK